MYNAIYNCYAYNKVRFMAEKIYIRAVSQNSTAYEV